MLARVFRFGRMSRVETRVDESLLLSFVAQTVEDIHVEGYIKVSAQDGRLRVDERCKPFLLHLSFAFVSPDEVGVYNFGRVVEQIAQLHGIHLLAFLVDIAERFDIMVVELHGAGKVGVDGGGAQRVAGLRRVATKQAFEHLGRLVHQEGLRSGQAGSVGELYLAYLKLLGREVGL